MRINMTEKDIDYISDLLSMGNSYLDISNSMGIPVEVLEHMWLEHMHMWLEHLWEDE